MPTTTHTSRERLSLLGWLAYLAAVLAMAAFAPRAARAVDPWAVRLGDCVYTEANFTGYGYSNDSECGGLRPLVADLVAEFENAWVGTSATSLEIGTGSKELLLTSGRAFRAGMPVRVADTAAPSTNYMDGVVLSWDAETGIMEVDVDATGGSGTKTSWSVFVLRSQSTVVSSPVPVADGGTGATTALGALLNLGVSRVRLAVGRLVAPPGSPSVGYYIVGPGGDTGAWSTADADDWAYWDGAVWSFESPAAGDLATLVLDDLPENSTAGNAYGLIVQYSGGWYYIAPIRERQTITTGTTAMVYAGTVTYPPGSALVVTKTGTNAVTYTLVSSNANREVHVRNQGASGDVTVNVASAGTIDGSASVTVAPDGYAIFVQVAAGKWSEK